MRAFCTSLHANSEGILYCRVVRRRLLLLSSSLHSFQSALSPVFKVEIKDNDSIRESSSLVVLFVSPQSSLLSTARAHQLQHIEC